MRVLVACEYSGVVRDAFKRQGHDAWSCDLLPTEKSGNHFQKNVLKVLNKKWDLMIAHPPCTYLCCSGNRWMKYFGRDELREEALDFVWDLMQASIPRIAIENPVGVISTQICKPSQIVQPWMFGHGETKATCLWLKNLPNLVPSKIVKGRENRIHRMAPSEGRGKDRSRTFYGIAEAMAVQWNF